MKKQLAYNCQTTTMKILFIVTFMISGTEACARQTSCSEPQTENVCGVNRIATPSNYSQKIDFGDLLKKQPEYFRTESQLEAYKQQVKSAKPNYYDTIRHCCCESQVQMKNLTLMALVNPPSNGSPYVSVVQHPGWYQYFEVWSCDQVTNCDYSCTCQPVPYVTSAVVYTTSYPYWGIKHVYVDGFCSCLNN